MIVRITSKFGEISSIHRTPHTGVDIGVPSGTPLRSIGDGIVDKIFDGTGAIGKGLSVKFGDGSHVIYGHMSAVNAKVGEHIREGQIVGFSGNTGHSTGPHLHLGLKDSTGQWVDPTPVADRVFDVDLTHGPIVQLWGLLREKFSEFTIDSVADHIANFAVAFPIIACASFGVYALFGMVSKGAAKWGAIGTMIYGLLVSLRV